MKRSDVQKALELLGIEPKGLQSLHFEWGKKKRHGYGTVTIKRVASDPVSGIEWTTHEEGIAFDLPAAEATSSVLRKVAG